MDKLEAQMNPLETQIKSMLAINLFLIQSGIFIVQRHVSSQVQSSRHQ